MTDFTPWTALVGGLLIGAGAIMLMLANGRVMGIAGMLGGLVDQPASKDTGWRLAFLAGLIAPSMLAGLTGRFEVVGSGLTWGPLAVAGFLVGFGTRMGNGCTSGHGICGLARLSRRSVAAVAIFMAVAALVVYVRNHVIGG